MTTRNKKKVMTAVDLFAGAGGFSLAAKELGFSVLGAIEIDPHARATYKRNFIRHKRGENRPKLFDDITVIDPAEFREALNLEVGELDLLMGGPPCQGFSSHRINGAGVDDPRNELLLRYFAFIRELKPRAFVVENVPGLLWPRHAKYLNEFKKMVARAGYSFWGPEELNAKWYGVPQNRKRVFMVGLRHDIKGPFEWPEPTHLDPASDEVRKRKRPAWKVAQEVFRKALRPASKDPNAIHMIHSPELVGVFKSTPKNGGSRRDSSRILPCHRNHNGHKDCYGRINPNVPGPTMTTACINPSKGRFVHPTRNHGITARHAARFQSFPDSFIFEGGLMAAGRQIGNAVPIHLGKAVLGMLRSILNIRNSNGDNK
jgi:DNA (cytosine-5)-methyltransferase 1